MTDLYFITTQRFPSLAYRKYGSGPAMLLLHGFPASGSLWDRVIPILSTRNTVLIPDLPGTGKSLPEVGETSMEELATGILEVLDKEEIDKAVLAGHSMGGYIALAFADLYGQRLNGLTMVHSTAFADDEEKKKTRRKAIELIENGGKEQFVRSMMPALFSEGFRKQDGEAVTGFADEGIQIPGTVMAAFYNAMINRPDRRAILQKAAFPLQWIIGREDSIVPADKILQQTTLSNVSFIEVYSSVGHMSMLEQPERLGTDLLTFTNYCASRS